MMNGNPQWVYPHDDEIPDCRADTIQPHPAYADALTAFHEAESRLLAGEWVS